MGTSLDKISIKGFKSIKNLENFSLNDVNILIGANGAGKSNLVDIFRMLREMVNQNLQKYVLDNGGADDLLFNGLKITKEIIANFKFGENAYKVKFKPTKDEKLLIKSESEGFLRYKDSTWREIGKAVFESNLKKIKNESGVMSDKGIGYYVYNAINSWVIYHFHDTSAESPMRRSQIVEDNKRLSFNASNIAPYLLKLKKQYQNSYNEIVNSIKLVAPFFDDFILDSYFMGQREKVKLSWKQKGSDYPMQAYHLSDGTLRFICLATVLLQPSLPSTIIFDEPELGLHPYAIDILSEIIHSVRNRTQLIISTQSPALVDNFKPENVIVVDRESGESKFKRLDHKELSSWLEDYTLGDIWQKNIISGGPNYE